MWFVQREVILTKDNLAKRNWNGCKKCCFCDKDETIQHIFISCPFATLIWRTVHVAYNLTPPTSIPNLFGNWLVGINKILKGHIRVGVCALLWAIWNCRNDCVFNRSRSINFLQVIFRATASIMWSSLQHGDAGGSWPLGATVWRWFHMRYSTGLAGMSLIDYMVKSCNLPFVPTICGVFFFFLPF